MKSWKLAVSYYLCGYLIATIGGFGSYFLLSETAMWVFTMTVMPVVFTWLGYRYFTDSRAASERLADCELVRLTGLWIVLSMTLDAVIYVFITPMVLGFPVNWSFFKTRRPGSGSTTSPSCSSPPSPSASIFRGAGSSSRCRELLGTAAGATDQAPMAEPRG